MSKPTLAFIGGGNMATSLVGGLLEQGYPATTRIIVSDPMEENRDRLQKQFGINTSSDNLEYCSINKLMSWSLQSNLK